MEGVCPNANKIEPNLPLGHGLARTGTLVEMELTHPASGSVKTPYCLLQPGTHPGNVGQFPKECIMKAFIVVSTISPARKIK